MRGRFCSSCHSSCIKGARGIPLTPNQKQSMKQITTAILLGSACAVSAGTVEPEVQPIVKPFGFEDAIRPISNPTLFDSALPQTKVHAMFMHHKLPSAINTSAGSLPLDGDVNIFAVQFEYAFNERFSITATKDGFIDLNPDETLSQESGFANLAAGVKYAFIYNPEKQYVLSGTAVVELPTGNSDVFQGTGDGALNLILSDLKLYKGWQFAGAIGAHIPFSNEESTTAFLSAHASYKLTEKFSPLIEVNWYRVIDEGDGATRFNSQVGGAVPSVAYFEGGDLINLGASQSKVEKDIVTLAVGGRYEISDNLSFGAAYEFPLTSEQNNLMDSRITLDLVWNF